MEYMTYNGDKAYRRCIGPWPGCGHADCTASPEYQAMIGEKPMPGVHADDENELEPKHLVALVILHALLRNTSTRGIPDKTVVEHAFTIAKEFHKQRG